MSSTQPITATKEAAPDKGAKQIFRSLSNPNYRLYFAGQLVSMIGTWMQQLALAWLTYRLTQSPFMLGAITFASQGPSMLLGPFAGVIPDLLNRHKLLITTQCLLMLQSLILAILVLDGHIQVWQIIALGAFSGIVNAVDMPTRQAFVVDMTEKKEDLGNVIALNSSIMNLTRLIGPALAGLVVAWWGEGTCFVLNSVSFVAVIGALLAIKLNKPAIKKKDLHVIAHIKEGFGYVAASQPIKFLLFSVALTSLSAVPYMVLMPVYVKNTFHGNAQLLGYMMAASSVGSLLATFMLASRKSVVGLGRWLSGSLVALSASLFIFGSSQNLAIALLAVALGGFGITMQMAASNTMLQTIVDDDKRGRVMSLFTMAFLGVTPIGGLCAGYLADRFGCTLVITLGGVLALLLSIFTYLRMPKIREHIRPIYIERGLIGDAQKSQEASN
ncbi:MAG: MFS transporter [Candidatus Obscuribacterales bacterium]|nr:MFS transporter [Candidatus Obscuribacterales bacterium]